MNGGRPLPTFPLRPVVRALLAYAVEHPDAKDSAVGIHRCWLGDPPPFGQKDVRRALEFLAGEGWLTKRPIGDDALFGVRSDRTAEMSSFLEALAAALPAGDWRE